MPDASGRIVPTFYSLSPERWAAIFEDDEGEPPHGRRNQLVDQPEADLTVLCRPEIDRILARKVAVWLWKMGVTDAEFYVWGDDADG